MRQLHLFVDGMSCRRCVREVTARLRDVPGVETVSANAGDCVVRLSGSMSSRTCWPRSPAPPTGPNPTAPGSGDSGETAAGKSAP